jgi:DNA-binding XRE family transcriptional regulator
VAARIQRKPERSATAGDSPRRRARSRAETVAIRATADQVRDARIRAGLTQEEAAGRADIDYKRWQRIEQGVANPTVATLARIASAMKAKLGVTFE